MVMFDVACGNVSCGEIVTPSEQLFFNFSEGCISYIVHLPT